MSFNTKTIYLQKETKTKESPAISKEFKAITTTNSNSKAFVAHSKSATKKASTINAKANTKIPPKTVYAQPRANPRLLISRLVPKINARTGPISINPKVTSGPGNFIKTASKILAILN